MAAKSLRDLNQKYRGKPKKYAEGGEVTSDKDADYDRRLLSRMKAQMGRTTEPTRAEQMQALRTAGREAAEGVANVLLPQSPLDLALMVALGPGGRAARLAGSAALASLEPSEAEASRLRRLIRAYHGSPHKFEEFDISKIGTGEGAQAYGRGLYFAENEGVARGYRDKLSNFPGGSWFKDALKYAQDWQKSNKLTDAQMWQLLENRLNDNLEQLRSRSDLRPDVIAEGIDNINKGIQFAAERRTTPGYMYEVNLNAAPREFLSWDEPLSQQSRGVQESLQRFGLRADPDAARAYDDALLDALYNDPGRALPPQPRDPTGEDIYKRVLRMDPEEARVALMQAGIPGTRYLDAGSRGVGGTSNYAVFDPEIIDITRRYAEGGLAELDQKYADGGMVREPATAYDPDEIDRIVQEFAEGGEVEAPAKTYISGQEHKLAYITDREAALLKARGGSGRMTKHGIRAYDEGPGEGPGSDNANSMSEAATQDAVGGNQGQGAGPTGAGAGGGPPGAPDSNPNQSMSSEDPEGTQAAANMQTAVDAREAGRGYGIADTGGVAPTGFNAAPGIAEALGALGRGEIGFGQALGYGVQSAISPPGVQMGVNVDEIGNQTPAVSVSVPGVIGGLMGLATGIPGASAIGSMIGNEIGKELGLDPTVMSYEPGVFNAPEPTPAYGAAGYGMDYGRGYAHGGLAKLHQKYAEGGEVEGNGGVERYDPREIDALASEFMAESNPADLMQRARLMMRGMNVGMPTSVGAVDLPENYQRYPRNENVSSFTSLREMPIEDDRFERALRTINTGINATLDQERKIRLGAGLLGVQDASDQGMTGYGANLSAGYGPVSLHGGYQSQLQAYPGAKPQEFYTYGGNLNIPLDDEGAKALLGAQVMSGRRGSAGAGNAGTLITGGLERPFRGGTLGVDVSVDPTLRNKEILFGYRRAF